MFKRNWTDAIAFSLLLLLQLGCSAGLGYNDQSVSKTSSPTPHVVSHDTVAPTATPKSITDTAVSEKFLGCWSGTKGGDLMLKPDSVVYESEAHHELLRILSRRTFSDNAQSGEGLELTTTPSTTVGSIIRIRFSDAGNLFVFGCASDSDIEARRYTFMGEFVRYPCSKRK